MAASDDSRREFLLRFAALSSASVLYTACSDQVVYGPSPVVYGPVPLYGPVPVTTVLGIDFRDTHNVSQALAGRQDVPVHTVFEFQFSRAMDTSRLPTVSLSDSSNRDVLCLRAWPSSASLLATPAADLQPNTAHTLRLGDDARDATGSLVQLTSSATASFKTGPAA